MVEESATGWVFPGSACVPGAGLGTEDGLICGKRSEALPPGIVVETPGTPATSGSAPIGILAPTLVVDRPGRIAVEPLGDAPADVPAPELFDLVGVGVGVVVAVFATVTVGPVAVAVRLDEVPLVTETVALYLIVSPAGAFFGTVTCASICDAVGLVAGRGRSQLVAVGLLEQVSTVKAGWL